MWEKINKLVDTRVNKYGIKRAVDAARICLAAKEVSNGAFIPMSFKNGILTISVKNSIEAQNVQLNSQALIKKINQKISHDVIKRLRFRIANFSD